MALELVNYVALQKLAQPTHIPENSPFQCTLIQRLSMVNTCHSLPVGSLWPQE